MHDADIEVQSSKSWKKFTSSLNHHDATMLEIWRGGAVKTQTRLTTTLFRFQTFATLAGVTTDGTGPAGFDSPDGIDQWEAIVAVANGKPPAAFPRQEVVIDLLSFGDSLDRPTAGKQIVAMRVGNHKLIYGCAATIFSECRGDIFPV